MGSGRWNREAVIDWYVKVQEGKALFKFLSGHTLFDFLLFPYLEGLSSSTAVAKYPILKIS